MSAPDHLFVVMFVFLHPLLGFVSFRRLLRRIAAGTTPDRMQLYRGTIVSHWALFAIGMLVWNSSDRDWANLGFSFVTDWRFFASAMLTVTGIGLFAAQTVQVIKADQGTIDKLGRKLGRLEMLVPHTRSELARFYWVSVSAGIVEEVLWRGFLIWYLTQYLPLWSAAVISAIGFGLAHAYQGIAQVQRIVLVGAVFVALYLISGSIWLAIVLHAAIDALQGRLAFEITHRRRLAMASANTNDQAVNS